MKELLKCIICGKKAKHRYSPDLDITGIGACAKHKYDVALAYSALLQGDEKLYKKLISPQIR